MPYTTFGTEQAVGATPGQISTQFNPNFQSYGNTYLIWGTDGVLQRYLVVSLSNKDRIVETSIEQGTGFTAVQILFLDGQDVEVEVVDSTAAPGPPTIANNPFQIVTPTATMTVLMVAQSSTLARKREGMRSWTFKSFTAISLGGNTTPL